MRISELRTAEEIHEQDMQDPEYRAAYLKSLADPGDRELYKAVGYDERELVTDRDEADMVSSRVLTNPSTHKPVLDIDIPAQLVPSSTPGHYHLYLDVEVDWPEYASLLCALEDAGVIQHGYAKHALRREQTLVRLPEKPKHLEGPDHPLQNVDSSDNLE